MNRLIKRSIASTLIIGFVMQLAACGTILHPERKGQRAGQLDTNIVVLDAIGLLFFLVPGVIAFAVDFNNGSIYLPGGSASLDSTDMNVVRVEGELTHENIEQAILRETGKSIDLDSDEVLSSNKTLTLSALKQDVRFL